MAYLLCAFSEKTTFPQEGIFYFYAPFSNDLTAGGRTVILYRDSIGRITYMGMKINRWLPLPAELKERLPMSAAAAAIKAERDEKIKSVFTGKSSGFIIAGVLSGRKVRQIKQILGLNHLCVQRVHLHVKTDSGRLLIINAVIFGSPVVGL